MCVRTRMKKLESIVMYVRIVREKLFLLLRSVSCITRNNKKQTMVFIVCLIFYASSSSSARAATGIYTFFKGINLR